MEPVFLWAAVRFCAQNGSTEALLSTAAQNALHLYGVSPLPGGFQAVCAAWDYRKLARLARKAHVRMRVQKRQGAFFLLRPLMRRIGLWAGCAIFVPLLLWSQNLVWAVDGSTLTQGQCARAAAILRDSVSLTAGAPVSEAALSAGKYALLQSGEFSWASLNFSDGRLIVEAAAAKPAPQIASGSLHGVRARTSGTITNTNLVSGTMLVTVGQQVEAGQGLIGTARSERDGTLIFEPAAGTVQAQFDWQGEASVPLSLQATSLTGKTSARYRIFFAGHTATLPRLGSGEENARCIVRHWQPELFGLPLPLLIEESTFYEQAEQTLLYTEEAAQAIARMRTLQALYAAYPDAVLLARKEDTTVADDILHYVVSYTVLADICE